MYHANVNVDLLEDNVIHINGGITMNVGVSVKNVMYVKKIMFGILLHVVMKMKSIYQVLCIMNDSAIMCDEIIESYNKETKTILTNFNEKKATYKTQNFHILLPFLLISTALLIAVSIYCYLITCQPKQKHLLPFHFTNNELKEIMY